MIQELSKIQDNQLLQNFSQVVSQEREAISSVVALLAEIDKRKLFAREGYSSLFSYCVERFHYSEQATYRRIQAARLSQKFSEIIILLDNGSINLTTVVLIARYLNQENKDLILNQVQKKSKKEIEKFLASLFPSPEQVKDKIRRLPDLSPSVIGQSIENGTIASDSSLFNFSSVTPVVGNSGTQIPQLSEPLVFQKERATEKMQPISARRVKIEFSASEELADKIERAKQVLRQKYPKAKLEEIFNQALEDMLEKRDPERKIERKKKRSQKQSEANQSQLKSSASDQKKPEQNKIQTRYIPETVKLEVWKRDEGRCSYTSSDGKRCSEKGFLELDHQMPWSLGGESSIENVRLLCRSHNAWRVGFMK